MTSTQTPQQVQLAAVVEVIKLNFISLSSFNRFYSYSTSRTRKVLRNRSISASLSRIACSASATVDDLKRHIRSFSTA